VDDGFAAFYQASWPRLVALVAGLTGSAQAAREVAAEAFGWALTGWERIGAAADPEAVVRNSAVRRARRRPRPADSLPATPVGTSLSSALTAEQREALVLSYLGGLSADEIAALTDGASAGTIKTRLAAARHALERSLGDAVGEDGLRDQLAGWVRPASELPAPGVEELPRGWPDFAPERGSLPRRRWLVIAAVVVVLAGAGAGLALGLAPGHPARVAARPEPQPAAAFAWVRGAWTPAGKPPGAVGVPPYYISVAFTYHPGAPTASAATVGEAASGAQLATISPPPGESLAGAAVAGDNRTFVLAAMPAGARFDGPSAPRFAEVRFYEMQLGPGGRPGALTLLLTLRTAPYLNFALSPDASELAVADRNGGIEVISLATGAHRTWQTPGTAYNPSWAGDQTLAFYFEPQDALPAAGAQTFQVKPDARSGVRLLNTLAPGTDLVASSRLLIRERLIDALPALGNMMVTADGTRLLAAVYTGMSGQIATSGRVEEFDARTGRLLGAVTGLGNIQQGSNDYLECAPLWSDPSGAAVLSVCGDPNMGTTQGIYYVHGKIDSTSMNTPGQQSVGMSDSFAW
jgi:RNA polymerase sigma-70 factor, ECF subfamily